MSIVKIIKSLFLARRILHRATIRALRVPQSRGENADKKPLGIGAATEGMKVGPQGAHGA